MIHIEHAQLVVEARHVDAAGAGQAQQHLVAPAGGALGAPGSDDVGDPQDRLLPVADDRAVDEPRYRLGVEGGVPPGEDDRVILAAVGGAVAVARRRGK